MPRPRCRCAIRCNPNIYYFKPRGIPMRSLDSVELSLAEVEALRLKNIQDLDQIDCARQMKISQSTFQRILSSAYKKIADALVNGKAIRISGER